MSLVNDLLIELDRQKEAPARHSAGLLDDLVPRRSATKGARHIRLSSALFVGATVLFVVVGLSSIVNRPLAPSHEAPPSVGARAPGHDLAPQARPVLATNEPSVALSPAATPERSASGRSEPDPILRTLVLQKHAGLARLQIEMDGKAAHLLERAEGDRSLVLFLDSARLAEPLSSLDLADTPIRSMSTHADGDGVRLELRFDSPLAIQSQALETLEGTTLFVDLQSLPVSSPAFASETRIHSRSKAASERTTPPVGAPRDNTRHDTRRDSTRHDNTIPGNTFPGDTSRWEDQLAALGTMGGPAGDEFMITRSAGDRSRIDRNTAQRLATKELEAARFALSEGDLEEADRRFASAIEYVPDHRTAIVEWASLLAKLSRVEQAIELIRNARRADAKDPTLALLHAHLLESSQRREQAIELLDRAGFSLTEAPEVHALAAAYLQRDGRHELAIDRYETIVRRYPQKSEWWMGLGISLEASKRNAEAVDVYRIAMQIGDLPGQTRRWVSGRIAALDEED